MKITNLIPWWRRFFTNIWNNTTAIELLVIIAIIAILAALCAPAFIAAKQRDDQQKETIRRTHLVVGDNVNIKGIPQRGTVNYIPERGWVDVLIVGQNGEPTILKRINIELITK